MSTLRGVKLSSRARDCLDYEGRAGTLLTGRSLQGITQMPRSSATLHTPARSVSLQTCTWAQLCFQLSLLCARSSVSAGMQDQTQTHSSTLRRHHAVPARGHWSPSRLAELSRMVFLASILLISHGRGHSSKWNCLSLSQPQTVAVIWTTARLYLPWTASASLDIVCLDTLIKIQIGLYVPRETSRDALHYLWWPRSPRWGAGHKLL